MKQTLLSLSLVLWAVALQGQGIYNDNARIVISSEYNENKALCQNFVYGFQYVDDKNYAY